MRAPPNLCIYKNDGLLRRRPVARDVRKQVRSGVGLRIEPGRDGGELSPGDRPLRAKAPVGQALQYLRPRHGGGGLPARWGSPR